MHFAQFKGKQVEIERTLSLCINGDHVSNILWVDCLMYVMKVGRFARQTNTVVDDLTIDFSFGHIYQRHCTCSPTCSYAPLPVCYVGLLTSLSIFQGAKVRSLLRHSIQHFTKLSNVL